MEDGRDARGDGRRAVRPGDSPSLALRVGATVPEPAADHVDLVARDPSLRKLYAQAALSQIPRLLASVDRNPMSPTYGCFDRQFWHYRTASFPSEMYQEAVLPLAQVFSFDLPGNRFRGQPRVRELAIAGLRYSARSGHADGSCDDYYPFERALGAAVFSLAAAAEAIVVLACGAGGLARDAEIASWLHRRARWIMRHDESGVLANHHALAAIGLWRVAQVTGRAEYAAAAEARVRRVLAWQSPEGWFEEYGGADPGYQTLTIECLAKYREATGATWLDEPLGRAVAFCRHFLHPDGSYAGEYGSRGTHHFFPAGFEMLASKLPQAADLADGRLRAMVSGKLAALEDDRMYVHVLPSLIDAYRHWSPLRPEKPAEPQTASFQEARILSHRLGLTHTVVSAARGGVFKHFGGDKPPVTDAGLIVELDDGRVAVSQRHDVSRDVSWPRAGDDAKLTVAGPLHFVRFERATPLKQAIFHAGMCLAGRFCRTLVRRLLQGRLITGRRRAPIRLAREFRLPTTAEEKLVVIDTILLSDPRAKVARMMYGSDHQTAYVAASGAYDESALRPWTDLTEYIETLNQRRFVVIERTF
jgi:hypothetical protein